MAGISTNAPEKMPQTMADIKAGDWCPHLIFWDHLRMMAQMGALGGLEEMDLAILITIDAWMKGAAKQVSVNCVGCLQPLPRVATGSQSLAAAIVGHTSAFNNDKTYPMLCGGVCGPCATSKSQNELGEALRKYACDSFDAGNVNKPDPDNFIAPGTDTKQ